MRARALAALKKSAPEPLQRSVTRASDLNRPELVLAALVQGEEITIEGRKVRLAESFELLVGVPKVQLDYSVQVEWVPVTCTLQGFILLCQAMSDAEAVEAAFATRF